MDLQGRQSLKSSEGSREDGGDDRGVVTRNGHCIDFSKSQSHAVAISRSTATVIIADTLSLPHPQRKFDFAICIAVIHHLSTQERRVEAIREILRKLRVPSMKKYDSENGSNLGQALLFVWALEQKNSRRGWDVGDKQDQLVPWVMKSDVDNSKKKQDKVNKAKNKLRTTEAAEREGAGHARTIIPSTVSNAGANDDMNASATAASPKSADRLAQDKTYHRFYHLYAHQELEAECHSAGAKVVESGFDRDNWWVVVEPDPSR